MTSLEKCCEADHVTMTELRDVAPAHFVLKIKSFSLFKMKDVEKYESGDFEAGGYKWKLILYPSGDKSRNGEDHISIYLAASGESPFQLGGEIHAAVRFCLYDQKCNRYLTEQGRVMRFHALKTECGAERYMPLTTFTDLSNGYLVNDTCVFGVEVFVIKSSGVGECLTLKESSPPYTHKWQIKRLSSLGSSDSHSDVFTVGGHKWKVWLYPRGNSVTRGQSLSMFLLLVDPDKWARGQKVMTRFTFRLKGRNNDPPYQRGPCTVCLSSSRTNWGWPDFMPLEKVRECLADDSFVVEAEVAVLGTSSKLP